jgi:hypothetical protein
MLFCCANVYFFTENSGRATLRDIENTVSAAAGAEAPLKMTKEVWLTPSYVY